MTPTTAHSLPLPEAPCVHRTASVASDAELGAGVVIHAFVVVEAGAKIGAGTVLHAHVSVGRRAAIGRDCILHAHSTVREQCVLGDRVTLESGSTVGSDGFGFATNGGTHHKIPQAGRVVIEDDAWIGPNAAIDRATMGLTRVGRGVRVEGLAQIGHNVEVGDRTVIEAQAGIAGSTKIGEGAHIGTKAGVLGHSSIGEGAVIEALAGVIKAVRPREHLAGIPATAVDANSAIQEALYGLPELVKQLQALRRRVDQLEAQATEVVAAGV